MLGFEQSYEGEFIGRPGAAQFRFEEADHVRDGDVFLGDVVNGPRARAFEHLLECFQEVDEGHCQVRRIVFADEVLQLRVGPYGFFELALLLEHFGGVFEPLVLEQTVHEFGPGIFGGGNFLQFRVVRQQQLRLDVDEGGRHVDEFGAQLDIHFKGFLHVIEILSGDLRDRDVVDVDLLLAN
jgi:hypothetical protein